MDPHRFLTCTQGCAVHQYKRKQNPPESKQKRFGSAWGGLAGPETISVFTSIFQLALLPFISVGLPWPPAQVACREEVARLSLLPGARGWLQLLLRVIFAAPVFIPFFLLSLTFPSLLVISERVLGSLPPWSACVIATALMGCTQKNVSVIFLHSHLPLPLSRSDCLHSFIINSRPAQKRGSCAWSHCRTMRKPSPLSLKPVPL